MIWFSFQLDGSLIIEADSVMGSTRSDDNGEDILQYGHRYHVVSLFWRIYKAVIAFINKFIRLDRCGRCRLENVKVQNQGVNWNCGDNVYWKHDVQRFEACKIVLHGNAEFEATDVTIQVRLTCNCYSMLRRLAKLFRQYRNHKRLHVMFVLNL